MSDEQRTKRSAKKPAWMNDEMLIDPAEVEAEVVRVPKLPARKPHAGHEMAQRALPMHHELIMPRQVRPSGRMCSNPQCKNPFDSPQWRRGPLGPGTLCNACGTRYARLQAKMNGDKKGKMRPQERAEWEAFEQQRLHPQPTQQTWRLQMQHLVQHEQQQQQQQYYGQEEDYGDYQESDYGYDERSYGSQGTYRREQAYEADADMADPEATGDGQMMYQEAALSGSPDLAPPTAAAAAAAVGGARAGRPVWRGSRQHFPAAEAATDSQEDEAGAYNCGEVPAGLGAVAAAGASSPGAPSSLLHLLAVGEAMIKTEGVAPQERRAAYTEVVGKASLGPEPEKLPARTAGGDPLQGVKRSRFALEAEEQQGGRPASNSEPTALQRALERFGAQAAPAQRSKPAGSEHVVAADRFERLLAEAEACVRARSVSPCMLKGMPGPGASPTTGNMPAPRPITPLQLGVNAVDSPHGIASFMLPAAAAGPRRPASATASDGFGRGRHASLAQAVAAAAAAEANSAGDEAADAGLQGSPNSQGGVSVSNADIVASRGDAARAFAAAAVDVRHSAEGTVGSNLPQDHHGLAGGDMPGHVQVLLGQMPSTEPSPMSKMLLADEVLSPTTMHMPAHARPRKQARVQGPAAGGVAGRRPGSGSTLSRSATPADRATFDGAAAAGYAPSGSLQHLSMQQHLLAQQGLPDSLLQQMMLQQGQHSQDGTAAGAGASMPRAADLQQAGHRPVVLACQLVLQQQSNPMTLQPLFEGPAASAAPVPVQAPGMRGLPSSAQLVSSALQLAQTGSGGNTQTHLDQLKAVTESAQAAAATASAVAAATALLWQQLQQQEQARARQREQELQQQAAQGQDALPAQGQLEGQAADVGGDAGEDAAAAAAAAAANEPAPPGSPAAAAVVEPAAAQAASGSISRSSSSSTSAAGLSTAPGDSHGVEQPPGEQAAGPDNQAQAPQQELPCPVAGAAGAVLGAAAAAVGAECSNAVTNEAAGVLQAGDDAAVPVPPGQHLGADVTGLSAGVDAVQQAPML